MSLLLLFHPTVADVAQVPSGVFAVKRGVVAPQAEGGKAKGS